ncbi:hypothetical protein DB41_CY00010 [Neochlamydia sp. TUME1]|nr:hypothetical protein DB41_CY00010 [Neochlamydia sp. TUME1]
MRVGSFRRNFAAIIEDHLLKTAGDGFKKKLEGRVFSFRKVGYQRAGEQDRYSAMNKIAKLGNVSQGQWVLTQGIRSNIRLYLKQTSY